MLHSPEAIALATSIIGSSIGGLVVWLVVRDTAPASAKRDVKAIIRDAPYDGLENVIKIAKS